MKPPRPAISKRAERLLPGSAGAAGSPSSAYPRPRPRWRDAQQPRHRVAKVRKTTPDAEQNYRRCSAPSHDRCAQGPAARRRWQPALKNLIGGLLRVARNPDLDAAAPPSPTGEPTPLRARQPATAADSAPASQEAPEGSASAAGSGRHSPTGRDGGVERCRECSPRSCSRGGDPAVQAGVTARVHADGRVRNCA